ncbi:MAG: hypothetical protein C4B55_04235 [Candidatus Methanophagaceae archaeon]|nr:MAG: hypothetical protein C4B55_04235 [Methanophagales archaeon]
MKKTKTSKNKPNICVVTHPTGTPVVQTILGNFIDYLLPSSIKLFAITGKFFYNNTNNTHIKIIEIKYNRKINELILSKIFKEILIQLRISLNISKISNDIDIVYFYIGTRLDLLPMLAAKLLGKKTVLFVTGPASKGAELQYDKMLFGIGRIMRHIFRILELINFSLADRIDIETKNIISFTGLNRYRHKISINGAMYIDLDNFKIKEDLKNKKNLIGYISRLSIEKGVLNFAKAIPLILKEKSDLEFLIGGDGPLFDEINEELKNNGSYDKVKFTGWIPHNELPNYLNELKLILLPSYSEGLPAIVQEGMACGAVVLATPVGSIPDVIKDGETGFILEDNSPECIAKNVIRALEHPNLEEIVKNARNLIEEEYSYEVMVRKCRDSLDELMR